MEQLYVGGALLIADVQNDFLPGGALAVKGGDEIVPVLRSYIDRFQSRGLPIFLSQDWHPPNHCSFREQGGPWPIHCVAGSAGALPPPSFHIPETATIIHKATLPDKEAYSASKIRPCTSTCRLRASCDSSSAGSQRTIASSTRSETKCSSLDRYLRHGGGGTQSGGAGSELETTGHHGEGCAVR